MVQHMVVRFRLSGDELFPVRFLEWLATELEQGNVGMDYADDPVAPERVLIEEVSVDGRVVVGGEPE